MADKHPARSSRSHRPPPHNKTYRPVDRRHNAEHKPDSSGATLIYGIHAVEAALSNPRRILDALWLTDNARHRLQHVLATRQLEPNNCRPADLDKRLGADTVHQGALLETRPLPDLAITDLIELDPSLIVVLDQVTDPHNVGAVLRSAAAFGATGMVMTRRNSPPLAGALAKAASGALELVPIALVQNLARAVDELKKAGVVCIGLDASGTTLIEDLSPPEAVAIILGAEGRGLRQLTKSSCDFVCRLLTSGPLESLNVSNAAAVGLHHLSYRRHRT